MQYNVNGEILTLRQGEGLFVNSKQLHFGYGNGAGDCTFLCVLFHPALLCSSACVEQRFVQPVLENGAMPEAYVKEKGLVQISDSSALEAAVDKVLADNPAEVEAFRGGKTKLISFFVGQVMRATRGKANPALVNELLAKKLAG